MSQVWIYDYALNRKEVINTDVAIKNFDSTVPQLTTFQVPKTTNISNSDFVIIKSKENFLGVVERVAIGEVTEVAVYPLEHKFDNDLDIDKLDGQMKVVEYLTTQITRNFIDTDDIYMQFPFVFESTLAEDVEYKTVVDTGNLLDVMNDIYLNTGVYADYEAVYSGGNLSAIKVVFKNVAEQTIKRIRFDHPQIVDKVSYEFSNTETNKATIWVGKTETEKGKPYRIYLREDNELTTNPSDEYRIKKVINKNIDLSLEENITNDQLAESIIVTARQELKSDVYGYKIEFTMIINPNSPWHYRQACVFKAEDRTFYSLVTRLEYLSEKHIRITLGAYRTRLHEKILKLAKPKQVAGKSLGGIEVSNGLGQHLYWFEKDQDGNLYVCSDWLTSEELSAMFELDENKNLYVNYADGQREALSIENGNLVGGY